jgi:MFS family permease
MAKPEPSAGRAQWMAYAVLMLALLFSFVDRQILLLAAEPIRQSLRMSDLQVGLLQGTGVALVGAAATYPLGWLADRFDRRWVLAGCVAVWSLSVLAMGFARNFEGLLVSSALAGAGEAGLSPILYAVIPMLFFGKDRQLANALAAIISAGGGALALIVGAEIFDLSQGWTGILPAALSEPWRVSFLLAALPSILVVPLILATPLLGTSKTPGILATTDVAPVDFIPFLLRHRKLLGQFILGGALAGFAFAAIAVWVAIIAQRSFGQTPAEVGRALGGAQLAATALAFVLNVAVSRRLFGRFGDRLPLLGMSGGLLVGGFICAALPLVTTIGQLLAFYMAALTCVSFASMFYPTALQGLSPAHLRGRMTAVSFLSAMVIASASPPLIGLLSDTMFKTNGHGLALSLAVVAAPALFLAAGLFVACLAKGFDRAVAEAQAAG